MICFKSQIVPEQGECAICFESPIKLQSSDCSNCLEGAWVICITCKDKLKNQMTIGK